MAETVSLTQIYTELKSIEKEMATKQDIHALSETLQILSNPETMRQLVESKEDIGEGRVRAVDSVQDMLSEA